LIEDMPRPDATTPEKTRRGKTGRSGTPGPSARTARAAQMSLGFDKPAQDENGKKTGRKNGAKKAKK
jgi:hypothetical protein